MAHRAALVAALGYVLAVVIATWPVALHPGEVFLGSEASDLSAGVWGFWWYARALRLHASPFHSTLLGYPFGGDFLVADPLNSLLAAPLQFLFTLPVAYNLTIMAHLWLAAFCTYSLLRYLHLRPAVAWCGGLMYGINPYVLGYVCNGVSQEVSVGWIPMFVLRFLMALRRPSPVNVGIAGLVLALGMSSSPYHAVCLVLSIPLVAWPFLRRRRLLVRSVRPIVYVTLIGITLSSVGLYSQLLVLQSPQTLEVRGGVPLRVILETQDGSDLLRWVKTGKNAWPASSYLHLPYLGVFGLTLAAFGVLKARRFCLVGSWLRLFVVFWVLACGFYLQIGDGFVLLGGRPIPLPYLFLNTWMPAFSWLHFPHRFAPPALLAGAVLFSFGVAELLKLLATRTRPLVVTLVATSLLSDFLLLSPIPYPLPSKSSQVPAFYRQLGDVPEAFGIVELPTEGTQVICIAKTYFYLQTVHQKGVPHGIDATFAFALPGAFARVPALRQLVGLMQSRGFVQRRISGAEVVRQLRECGYRYLVVHLAEVDDTALTELHWLLDPVVSGAREEDGLLIYPLELKS